MKVDLRWLCQGASIVRQKFDKVSSAKEWVAQKTYEKVNMNGLCEDKKISNGVKY